MSAWRSRYLRVLDGAEVETAPPDLETLRRLTRAQVERIPFENVTAILRRAAAGDRDVPPVDLDALVAAWEARSGGGVCFDGTPMYRRLLQELGYRVRPTVGLISFAGSHQASIVTLDEADYLVDVANGAPFFAPIPIDGTTVIEHAGLSWRFHRTEPQTLTQDRLIGGQWQPFCHYALGEPDREALESAYQRHHRPGETWVVGSLTLVRCLDDQVIRLRDLELLRFSSAGVAAETVTADDLPRVADEVFGLPNLPVTRAWSALRQMQTAAS